jgi:hypothetical protein
VNAEITSACEDAENVQVDGGVVPDSAPAQVPTMAALLFSAFAQFVLAPVLKIVGEADVDAKAKMYQPSWMVTWLKLHFVRPVAAMLIAQKACRVAPSAE